MSESTPLDEEAYETIGRLCGGDPETHIESLRDLRPSDETTGAQLDVFKALANEDRLRIVSALRESECCVCELQVVLDAPQSTVATHLRKLRASGLVKARKKGKWRYYRIADTAVLEVLDLATAIDG
ncbi:ArsR/SmtB family transcription factor [Natronobiforma cellulositropha]|uniref:ArsR/SmtB family transcription factor n=1 Tax=Natronobiforma cellulositropha TaxID=1679076 RepID=UPI0021D5BDDF|nr:metalloregulator ArsR/SmtB family transcription factor [Natronobiforma cellulositropha]